MKSSDIGCCYHSYVIKKVEESTTYGMYLPGLNGEMIREQASVILSCQHCGHAKKVHIETGTTDLYKVGENWEGKKDTEFLFAI
jgi:hypothetical protein